MQEKISEYVLINYINGDVVIRVEEESIAVLNREEAIAVAKSILRHYGGNRNDS